MVHRCPNRSATTTANEKKGTGQPEFSTKSRTNRFRDPHLPEPDRLVFSAGSQEWPEELCAVDVGFVAGQLDPLPDLCQVRQVPDGQIEAGVVLGDEQEAAAVGGQAVGPLQRPVQLLHVADGQAVVLKYCLSDLL